MRRRHFLGSSISFLGGGILLGSPHRARAAAPRFTRLIVVNASGGLRSTAAFHASPLHDANPWGVAGPSGSLRLGNLLSLDGSGITHDAPSWPDAPLVPSITEAASNFSVLAAVDHCPGLYRAGDHPDETPRMGTGWYGKPTAPGLMTVINRHVGLEAPGPVAMIGGGGWLGRATADWVPYAPVGIEYYGLPPAPPTAGDPIVGRPLEDALDDRLRMGRRALGRDAVDAYWITKDALRRYGPVLADPALHLNKTNLFDHELGGITNRMMLEGAGNVVTDGSPGGAGGIRLGMAVRLLQLGSPAVTVDVGGFDFHDGEDAGAPEVYTRFARYLAGLHFLLSRVPDEDGIPLIDSTVVVTTSECSRTSPAGGFNDAGGTDHGGDDPAWRWQAHVVFGAGITPKRLADTDDTNTPIDGVGHSTQALLATLCEGIGVPPDAAASLWPPGGDFYPEGGPILEMFD